jgi:uncharacterized protein
VKIVIGKSADNKNASFDLDTLLTTRLLIQANSGAGKSWLLRRLMEQLFGHVQVIAIDPEGEFSTLREKFDYVLVGKGGETPAHLATAEHVAHKLLELRASAVCDIYETPAAERHIWVQKFLEALIDAPKKLWHPAVIIVDEAQMFCPEKGESVAADAMVNLTTRGRKRGFCAVWATQRLANVNKDATSMLLNRLVGGTFEDVDIKRALDLLSVPSEEKHQVSQQLKTLDPGQFFAFGRAVSKERILLQVGDVSTSHPKPGSSKHAAEPPEPSEKVRAMLGALAEIPKVAEEKARTLDDYKKQVRDLKTEVLTLKRAQPKVEAAKPGVDVPTLKRTVQESVEKSVLARDQQWMRAVEDYTSRFERTLAEVIKRLDGQLRVVPFKMPDKVSKVVVTSDITKAIKGRATVEAVDVKASPYRPPAPPVEAKGDVTAPEMRIIASLAEAEAMGRKQINRAFLATLTRVSASSGGFRNKLGSLRSKGMVDYPQDDFVSLTMQGREIAPAVDPPTSPDEMLDRCKAVVSKPQAAILDSLFRSYPNPIDRVDLAGSISVSESSGGFRNKLGSLRTAGMIDYPSQGTVKLQPWVMLEDQ